MAGRSALHGKPFAKVDYVFGLLCFIPGKTDVLENRKGEYTGSPLRIL